MIFRDLPWYYAELLKWRVENGILKVFPKLPVSDRAHKAILKAFRRWGGKYVSWNGRDWYELVLEPRMASTPVAVNVKRAYEELQKET